MLLPFFVIIVNVVLETPIIGLVFDGCLKCNFNVTFVSLLRDFFYSSRNWFWFYVKIQENILFYFILIQKLVFNKFRDSFYNLNAYTHMLGGSGRVFLILFFLGIS